MPKDWPEHAFTAPGTFETPEILQIRSRQVDYAKPTPGTYLTTGLRAARGYRLSKFCRGFMAQTQRETFKANAEKAMSDAGLDEYEKELVRKQDWNGMLRYGVSAPLLRKLAAGTGVGEYALGAAMRGQSYDAFLATRNVKDAV